MAESKASGMRERTKAEWSAAAEKAAAIRKRNEARESGDDLKRAAQIAVTAAKDLGVATGSAAKNTARSLSKR